LLRRSAMLRAGFRQSGIRKCVRHFGMAEGHALTRTSTIVESLVSTRQRNPSAVNGRTPGCHQLKLLFGPVGNAETQTESTTR
jgi:hypothetical protein